MRLKMLSAQLVATVLLALIACAPVAPVAPVAPAAPAAPVAPVAPDAPVSTMRLDYVHSGGPGGESVTLDAVTDDGAWPGSRTALIDDTGLGEYFFEVTDAASGRTVYSRGFDSIYGEWETTPEVRVARKTFHESLRFPWPRAPVHVTLRKRDARNVFTDLWSATVDPRGIAQRPRAVASHVRPLLENGPTGQKVDLLLISEGYAIEEMPKFRDSAARLLNALFSLEPFKARQSDFNVRLLEAPGRATSVEFNVFGIERYAVTYANRDLRDLAASAPYDALVVVVNETKYGGGGIFNQQSTVAAGHAAAEYVFIHELAHNLAGLADEYVGNVTYETGRRRTVEPWEPNLTALLDVKTLKWRDLVRPDTPIPTPLTYAGRVGAFEGGGYEARGVYRPEAECIMGSRRTVPFCRVCQRAINRAIDLQTR